MSYSLQIYLLLLVAHKVLRGSTGFALNIFFLQWCVFLRVVCCSHELGNYIYIIKACCLAPAYDLYDMADDVSYLMDHLNIASVHLVGGSLGGMITQVHKSYCLCLSYIHMRGYII